MATKDNRCPHCGTELPPDAIGNVCPKCLMKAGLINEPDVTIDSSSTYEGPGTKIGHYELLELIGEGGMGLVYLAEDALKTLVRSAKIQSDAGEEPDPVNLVFMAMALHRIGQIDEAKTSLDKLRELCKDEQYAEDIEVQNLLAEAEKLIIN